MATTTAQKMAAGAKNRRSADPVLVGPARVSWRDARHGHQASAAKRLRYAAETRAPQCGARTSAPPLGAVLARFRAVLRFQN